MRGNDEANKTAVEERYKEAKREAKKAVARAKEKAYEDLYKRLDSKEGVNNIYRIAKAIDRKKRDLGIVRFIKDGDGKTIVNEDAIRRRWKEYFFDLFNGQRSGRTKELDSMDELTKGIQESVHWCLIFADDIVLVLKMPQGMNGRLEQWRKALEDEGLRVSREKTEYLRCNFNRNDSDQNEEIRIGDHIFEPKESFRYLGSVMHKSGRIEDDVTHRIQVGWLKWRASTGILYDKNVPLKLKGKFYRVAIRPAMLYGSECWPLTKVQANRMEVAEMRMLRWTCGKTIFDMIPNGVFRTNLQVVTIVNKMREGRLRWFGHVKRRPQSAPVRIVEALTVDGARRRGRPKLRWEDRLKTDLKEMLLSEDMTCDRSAWRSRIRVDEGA
ncbi:hypothetical protein Tco_1450433 [Tanacetum coccineum]